MATASRACTRDRSWFRPRLAAGLSPNAIVVDRKADPAARGHARDRRKAHAGHPADYVQDDRNGRDTVDRLDVRLKIAVHPGPKVPPPSLRI